MPKQQRENRKTVKFMNFQQRKGQSLCESTTTQQQPSQKARSESSTLILYLLAKSQVLRKSRHLSLSHYFTNFNVFLPRNK